MTQSQLSKNDFRFAVAVKVEGLNCRQLALRVIAGLVTIAVIVERFVTWLMATTP
jgi:transposase